MSGEELRDLVGEQLAFNQRASGVVSRITNNIAIPTMTNAAHAEVDLLTIAEMRLIIEQYLGPMNVEALRAGPGPVMGLLSSSASTCRPSPATFFGHWVADWQAFQEPRNERHHYERWQRLKACCGECGFPHPAHSPDCHCDFTPNGSDLRSYRRADGRWSGLEEPGTAGIKRPLLAPPAPILPQPLQQRTFYGLLGEYLRIWWDPRPVMAPDHRYTVISPID